MGWGHAGSLERGRMTGLGGVLSPTCLPFYVGLRGKGVLEYPPVWLCGFRELVCPQQGCQLLRILVENQGRVNYSWKIQDQRKGGL